MVLCLRQVEEGQEVHKVTISRDIPWKYMLNSVKREEKTGIINCIFRGAPYEVSELYSDVQLVLRN